MIYHSPYKQKMLSEKERFEYYHNSIPSPSRKRTKSPPSSSPKRRVSFQEKEDQEQLKVLTSLGYDENLEKSIRPPGMPRIGSKIYDSMTGHHLIYIGNGNWKRISSDEVVNFKQGTGGGGGGGDDESYDFKDNLPVQSIHSIVSEDSKSIIVPPEIYEQRSGVIEVRNKEYFPSPKKKKDKKGSSRSPSPPRSRGKGENNEGFLSQHERSFRHIFETNEVESDHLLGETSYEVLKAKSNLVTTGQIVDSFLTGVGDTGDNRSISSHERFIAEPKMEDRNNRVIRLNEKTKTPYRGMQKVPYLALQLKAKQQLQDGDNNSLNGSYTQKKKKIEKGTRRKQDEWKNSKSYIESLSNDLIRNNSVLSNRLMDLIYSTENDNELLLSSLISGNNRDLLDANRESYFQRSNYQLPGAVTASASGSLSKLSKQEKQLKDEKSLLFSQYSDLLERADNTTSGLMDEDDDDMVSVWKRAVYKKPKEHLPKVVVWNKPAPQHYHFKYTWIPQPLVNNAVHELYYDRSYREISKETKELVIEKKITKKQLDKDRKSQLIDIVAPLNTSPTRRQAGDMTMNNDISLFGTEEGTFSPQRDTNNLDLYTIAGQSKLSSLHSLSSEMKINYDNSPSNKSQSSKSKKTILSKQPTFVSSLHGDDSDVEDEKNDVDEVSSFVSYYDEEGQIREMPNGVSLRHNLSSSSVSFPEFMGSHQPNQLTKPRYILESSAETVQYRGQKKHRKFQYRPVGRKTAKVNPDHPYEWH
jgi:predicted nuclease with TOPRIM domain